jgi:glyoxylase-like metal-dependent hydrolase (beta-lactamase superfamily II)
VDVDQLDRRSRGPRLIVVDPGIHGAELEELADDLEGLGVPVVAGFSTHPHFDHLLWHSRFGDVPRYATDACARRATEARERARSIAAVSAEGVPLELVALVIPLPADGGPLPGELIEHRAHAVGHAAILLADRRPRLRRGARTRGGPGRRPPRAGLAGRPPPVEPGAGPGPLAATTAAVG